MPWMKTEPMEERIQFIGCHAKWRGNFSELCDSFGISRKTGYKWLKRYDGTNGLNGLRDQSRRPKVSPNRTSAEVEERIVEHRQREGWGAKKIIEFLHAEGISISVATINRVLSRHHLLSPIHQHQPALSRFERSRPLELIQADFKGPMGRTGNRSEPLSILDDHSRYLLGLYAVKRHTVEEVQPCFVDVFKKHGVPNQILFDHGVPWWSTSNTSGITRLSVFLMKQDIELIFGRIRHPQTQGKVERFHRTLDHSVAHHFHGQGPSTPDDWQPFYNRFQKVYNTERPHEALNMNTPSSRYAKSPRRYQPHPPPWNYPQGVAPYRVDAGGWVRVHNKRLFVSEALAGEWVGLEPVADHLLVSYRKMYLRELNPLQGYSQELVYPISFLNTSNH